MPDTEYPDLDYEPVDGWSEGAVGTFANILGDADELSEAEVSELYHACSLESAADAHDEVARAAGYVATGSTGQTIVHPSSVEARLCRSAAATILARLVRAPESGRMSASERGRMAAQARHRSRRSR